MILALLLWVCLLCANIVTCQENNSAGSRVANIARQLAESPELGKTVERVVSRALGVPQPRLASLGTALQGLFSSFSLANLQASLTAVVPGIALSALVISIIALVKVSILFKSSGLDPFDNFFGSLRYGTAGQGYAAGAENDGYSRYDPTEYVHHAPQPIGYDRHEEHGLHTGYDHHEGRAPNAVYVHHEEHGLHQGRSHLAKLSHNEEHGHQPERDVHHETLGDVTGYAGHVSHRDQDSYNTGVKSRHTAPLKPSSTTESSRNTQTAKPGRVFFS